MPLAGAEVGGGLRLKEGGGGGGKRGGGGEGGSRRRGRTDSRENSGEGEKAE